MAARRRHVVVVGAGFCGLAAAYELLQAGCAVTVLEQEDAVGGLARSFDVEGVPVERFYHHWFTSDAHIMRLIDDIGCSDKVRLRATRTGMYYANRIFRLSTPLDLLRFDALGFGRRIRLGLMALRARAVTDWRQLEDISAEQWLRSLGGDEVFRVVWEPLLRGKFGEYAGEVSAVWFWNKLKLRGSSRDRSGAEQLAYFEGGFSALCGELARVLHAAGGELRLATRAVGVLARGGLVSGVRCASGESIAADAVLITTPLPQAAEILCAAVPADYLASLRRIRYLANICLVLELDRSLSETYWLNVNDPEFPFVGVIEHTNFEPAATYGGRHVVYLSKYLPESAELFNMSDEDVLAYTLPYLQRMFPLFGLERVLGWHVWRAQFSQPLVECHYGRLVPATRTPLGGAYIASMAQIYPEDRGTNYAVRQGREAARLIAGELAGGH